MLSIAEINKVNRRSPARHEDPWSRASSFVASRRGVVLHSASLRSTAFISDPKAAKAFLTKARKLRRNQAKLNHHIEAFF